MELTGFGASRYKRTRGDEEVDPDAVEITGGSGHNASLVGMWRKGRFCDATVVVDGQNFAVHRVVLAIESTFFASAFDGGWVESGEGTIQLALPGGAAAWAPIAEWLYTGRCLLSSGSLLPLLEAANFLQIEGLMHNLAAKASARITPATFGDAWEAAGRLMLRSEDVHPRHWSFERMLVHDVTRSVENITAFACSPGFATLPDPVLSQIRDHTTSLRKKTIRLLMVRDGSASSAKVSKAEQAFTLLGGGVDDVSFTIDKQARVEVSWVAKPETCVGGSFFEIDFTSLRRHLHPGCHATLSTCSYHPGVKRSSDSILSAFYSSPARYTFEDTKLSVDTIRIAAGFPKVVRASPGGPPLSHYQLVLDVGLSYGKARAKLEARQRDGGPVPGEGFYRSDARAPGHQSRSYSLLVWTGEYTGESHVRKFLAHTPEGREYATTRDRHLREAHSKIEPPYDPADGWTRAYTHSATSCVHGSSCGEGVGAAAVEEARGKATEKVSATALDGGLCTKGRRFRTVHVISGSGLVPLWAQLEPKAIVTVDTSVAADEVAHGGESAGAKIVGVWVDAAHIPKY